MQRRRWLLATLLAVASCTGTSPRESGSVSPPARLRVVLHTEPQTWNRLLAADWVTHVVTDQIHAPLLRIDPGTQALVPSLAESWEYASDTTLVMDLREGVRFSDGAPFTARDVAFTFQALYDERVASPLVETALVDGKPLEVEVIDETTVAFHFPRRTAALERMFDSIPVLPSHRLEESLERGELGADTGLGAPAPSIVGLGPFVPVEFAPGERIVLERNPHYWREGEGGEPLPRLDGIVFEIVPDASARLIRFRAGEVDLLEPMSPETFERLRLEGPEALELVDAGPGMLSERLWFNANLESPIEDHKKAWFRDARFRRAVSLSIDREALARVVYRGLATPASGPVSPANRFWKEPSVGVTAPDPDRARALLVEAGFGWDERGQLCDADGRPVEITILVKAASDLHARAGAFLIEDLGALGVEARVVPLEASALIARLTGSFDYEACLLGITQTDPDPSAEMPFWLSRSALHLWHPRQTAPATEWEARIDELMLEQQRELDPTRRRRLFGEVQRIVDEQLPVIDLLVPHVLLGVHRRVRHLRPNPFTHALWNGWELDVDSGDAPTRGKTRDENH